MLPLKLHIFLKKLFPRRKYKDLLFGRVFNSREDLLELYNAINKTNYTNADDLTITTLEDAIYLSMKNDLSFIFASTLNLYEHQSTPNPNMPIRGVMYFSKLYEAYISLNKLDIYGSKLVKLPLPQYIVFYNGSSNQPDEQLLKLSDAFISNTPNNTPALECTVRVLNINYGHNTELLNTCKRLSDYSQFIYTVYEYRKQNYELSVALTLAMDYCINNDILSDILVKNRAEVFNMLLTYYDEELHNKTLRQEGYESGYESAISEIESLKLTVADRDAAIADKDAAIADKDAAIADKDAAYNKLLMEFEEYKRTH